MSFIDSIRNFRRNRIIAGFSGELEQSTFERMTVLQNEISVSYNTKVLGITSINDNELSCAFAAAFAKSYAKNGAKTLIIDANLYCPTVAKFFAKEDAKENEITALDEKISFIHMKQEIYPSETYKAGTIHQFVENAKDFDHILILVPSIRDHKEVSLLQNILDSMMLVVQKNVTRKCRIYDAAAYCAQENIPLSKVVVLK